MMRVYVLVGLLGVSGMGMGVCAGVKAPDLWVGGAKQIITPRVEPTHSVFIAGFGNNRTATGVHDDLWVRCMAISDRKTTLVIAVADVIGLFYEEVVRIRQEVAKRVRRKSVHLIVASTHNHNGPDTLGLWGPDPQRSGVDSKYMAFLRAQIVKAVLDAIVGMRPARLIFAQTDEPELDKLQGDGRLPIVKDTMLRVMQGVDRQTKQTIATLIQWSNHPETLGGGNRLITADYCAVLCQTVEEAVGGVAVYANGAVGGMMSPLDIPSPLINPETNQPIPRRSFEEVEFIGRCVGKIAVEALRSGERVEKTNLRVHTRQLFIPLQNARFRPLAALKVIERQLYRNGKPDDAIGEIEVPKVGKTKGLTAPDLMTEVSLIDLGKAQIATVPGEIYPELVNGGYVRYPGADFPDAPFEPIIREQMSAKYKFVIGLANDEIGYIIPRCEWDEQPPWLNNAEEETYGEVNSVGVEAARLITTALAEIARRARAQKRR